MTTDREHLLCKYLEDTKRYGPTASNEILSIIMFLNDVDELSVRSYRSYRKRYASRFLNNESRYIIDFLSFNGIKVTSRQIKDRKQNNNIVDRSRSLLIDESEVNDFIHWLNNRYDYSENTMRIYNTGIRQYFQFSKSLSNESVRDYIRYMEKLGLSPKTIRLRILPIKLYAEFKKKNIIVKEPKISRSLSCDNIPNEDDYKTLIQYLLTKTNKKYYLFIRILATTGVRLCEFRSITWNDVRAGEKVLRGKGNKYRKIYFQKALIKEVEEYIPKDNYSDLVATGKYGTPLARESIRMLMQDWAKATGIDKRKLHPHAFRHFFAKQYLKVKKDPIQLAEYLGHSSLDTTRIYLQKTAEEQRIDFNSAVKW